MVDRVAASQRLRLSDVGLMVAGLVLGCTDTPTDTATFTVGGTVSGLMGTGLMLRNNGGDDLAVSANGVVTFAAPLASGAAYRGDRVFTRIDAPGALSTLATGINPAGDIVGRYTDASMKDHGFLWHKGSYTTIDFPGDVFFTAAANISPSGDIVGNFRFSSEGNAVRHGYLLAQGEYTWIDYPGATFTNALGINPQGEVVGRYMMAGGPFHGYLLTEGEFTTIDVPGAVSTHGWEINQAGEIVGNYQGADGIFHVFLLSRGAFTSIDFPAAVATAPFPVVPIGGINALGDIVSTYCDRNPCALTSAGNVHGFLRTSSSGEFTSIDFPGAIGTGALGINPRGDIVGLYLDTNLKTHGFLWANP